MELNKQEKEALIKAQEAVFNLCDVLRLDKLIEAEGKIFPDSLGRMLQTLGYLNGITEEASNE